MVELICRVGGIGAALRRGLTVADVVEGVGVAVFGINRRYGICQLATIVVGTDLSASENRPLTSVDAPPLKPLLVLTLTTAPIIGSLVRESTTMPFSVCAFVVIELNSNAITVIAIVLNLKKMFLNLSFIYFTFLIFYSTFI